MVPAPSVRCEAMGEPTDYATRLRTAKKLAGVADDKTLAKNVGISLQAINKIWAGTSKALSAANNVRAARYLAVDSEWLARLREAGRRRLCARAREL